MDMEVVGEGGGSGDVLTEDVLVEDVVVGDAWSMLTAGWRPEGRKQRLVTVSPLTVTLRTSPEEALPLDTELSPPAGACDRSCDSVP